MLDATAEWSAVWLREAMAQRHMSQRRLAERSKVDHSTISRLLSGSREPTFGVVVRLYAALSAQHVSIPCPTCNQHKQ